MPALHANKLGFAGLRRISADLLALHERLRLGFDFYFIEKRAYAIVMFFNAVFDQGVNEAVPWLWYWTPLRFPLIASLHTLLDDSILCEAWDLCLVSRTNTAREEGRIVALLRRCLGRIDDREMQAKPREIIRDALLFGIRNPLILDFGAYSQKAFSPNAVGFQFVLAGIARRSKLSGRSASRILVDKQQQFNAAQLEAYSIQFRKTEWFRRNPEDQKEYLAHPFLVGAEDDMETLISHYPQEKMTICDSKDSIGLQLTDAFLWLINRALREDANVPPELRKLVFVLLTTGMKNGISLPLMISRWQSFERSLPPHVSLSTEQKTFSDELVENHREKVRDMKLDE